MIQIDENWRQESGLYKCPHCSKEYSKSGIGPHIWRSHTEDRKKHREKVQRWHEKKAEKVADRLLGKKQFLFAGPDAFFGGSTLKSPFMYEEFLSKRTDR